ncbi:hypothetical protein X726_22580 [Mesorhizobium sp. L103C105A0]|nr:hypothetical protein X726_22580 [Mesorhizobium sp. L103C105A0]
MSEWKVGAVFSTDTKSLGKTSEKKIRRNAYTYKIWDAEAEIISKPKKGYERRNIHITHPIPQALLIHELSNNWKAVQKWLCRQTFSEDEIRVSSQYERSIKGINFPIHGAKKAYLEATSDWVVKTDISRFYPTIYTHSISWAAYGKTRVKQEINKYKGSLADRIDLLVRSCNRNQTIGIPIGPESSRIIAEVISSRIDTEFHSRCRHIPRECIDRLQDDWFVGVDSLEKAEKVLSIISSVYRDYGLEINGSKTSIESLVASKTTSWIAEIGAFLSHRPGQLNSVRLREFLQLCLRLQTEFRSEPVVSYALSVIESSLSARSEVEILESFLLKAAAISPMSMDRVCRIFLNLQHRTKALSKQRVTSRFTTLAERYMERGHSFEVIWLLYTLRGLKCPLSSKVISDAAETTASSSLGLVLLDMQSKGLCIRSLPKAEWENSITDDRVRSDWIWLLAYEGFRHGWLNDKKGLMAKSFFKPMASRNVVFYDPKKNVQKSEKIVKAVRGASVRNAFAVAKMFETLRGLNNFTISEGY